MVQKFLAPLVQRTGCRRILLHNPFPNGGQKEMPIMAPVEMRAQMRPVYDSFVPAFTELAAEAVADGGAALELIEYHGAATQLAPTTGSETLAHVIATIRDVFSLANACGHSIALDMASKLTHHHPMAMLMPVLDAFMRPGGRRVYMEQRRGRGQLFMLGMPTVTALSELIRQEDRGGEPSLAAFDPAVENILLADVVPPDRDELESRDPWIVEQVEAWQADERHFTPAVPVHSMVNRGRWDLLERIFGGGVEGTGH
jgi:hypothetical protein